MEAEGQCYPVIFCGFDSGLHLRIDAERRLPLCQDLLYVPDFGARHLHDSDRGRPVERGDIGPGGDARSNSGQLRRGLHHLQGVIRAAGDAHRISGARRDPAETVVRVGDRSGLFRTGRPAPAAVKMTDLDQAEGILPDHQQIAAERILLLQLQQHGPGPVGGGIVCGHPVDEPRRGEGIVEIESHNAAFARQAQAVGADDLRAEADRQLTGHSLHQLVFLRPADQHQVVSLQIGRCHCGIGFGLEPSVENVMAGHAVLDVALIAHPGGVDALAGGEGGCGHGLAPRFVAPGAVDDQQRLAMVEVMNTTGGMEGKRGGVGPGG